MKQICRNIGSFPSLFCSVIFFSLNIYTWSVYILFYPNVFLTPISCVVGLILQQNCRATPGTSVAVVLVHLQAVSVSALIY